MIKVEVTHLKAPWPSGAVVGSVVLLAAAKLPAWAAGKCTPVPDDDDREPVGLWEPSPPPGDPEFVVNPAAEADREAAEAAAMLETMGQHLLDAEQALGTARAEIQSLGAQLAERHRELIAEKSALEEAEAANERAEAYLLDAIQERDAARTELASLRAAVPAVVGTITGTSTSDPLPLIEEPKASAPTKASKKAAA